MARTPAPPINTRRLRILIALYPGMLPPGSTASGMSNYTNGIRNPSDASAKRIAEHYGVSLEWLRDGAPQSVFESLISQLLDAALPPLTRPV